MVTSMASLMESALDDGEEAMVITSDHVTISCLVTSAVGPVGFETGEGASSCLRYTRSVFPGGSPCGSRMMFQRML